MKTLTVKLNVEKHLIKKDSSDEFKELGKLFEDYESHTPEDFYGRCMDYVGKYGDTIISDPIILVVISELSHGAVTPPSLESLHRLKPTVLNYSHFETEDWLGNTYEYIMDMYYNGYSQSGWDNFDLVVANLDLIGYAHDIIDQVQNQVNCVIKYIGYSIHSELVLGFESSAGSFIVGVPFTNAVHTLSPREVDINEYNNSQWWLNCESHMDEYLVSRSAFYGDDCSHLYNSETNLNDYELKF